MVDQFQSLLTSVQVMRLSLQMLELLSKLERTIQMHLSFEATPRKVTGIGDLEGVRKKPPA